MVEEQLRKLKKEQACHMISYTVKLIHAFFFLLLYTRGNISYSRHQILSHGQHPKKRFWINQPLQVERLIEGMYTSMQKY